jgi:hypothetical protein
MERRRALLAGGGADPYIYKPGFTEWKNVESATTSGSITVAFETNYASVKAGSTSSSIKLNLLISEKTYKKFSKIVFRAMYIGSGGSPKITWTNVSSGSAEKTTSLANVGSATTFTYDISASAGDRYFSIAPYYKGGIIYIYDIHFE